MKSVILPGSTIGLLGGGQLGRMFVMEARRMGYRVHCFCPEAGSPAIQVSDKATVARYEDEAAVRDFARSVDVVTFEFENIPVLTLQWCAQYCEVRPSGRVLYLSQDRLREKTFLSENDLPLASFSRVTDVESLGIAIGKIGAPAVLKGAAFGYDGKGQHAIFAGDDPVKIWNASSRKESVLEKFVSFTKELSVIVAREVGGAIATYAVCENVHRNHILDITVAPALVSESVRRSAVGIATKIAEKLELVGILAVEMFLLPDEKLLVNELAPRPHNSGHWTLGGSVTSQFEQQLRAVCGLGLGSTDLLRPAAMANLLGDLWERGEPDWKALSAFPDVKLHLYGKSGARKGRKMGHLLAFGESTTQAAEQVARARTALAGA